MPAVHEIEPRLRELLEHAPEELVAAYLFGSVARGESTPASDVDVAVLLRRRPRRFSELPLGLESRLEAGLGRTTQVVTLNSAPPDLVHRILRDGHLLLDRDPAARIRFEVQARNEFFDLEPFLRRYRRTERRPGGPAE